MLQPSADWLAGHQIQVEERASASAPVRFPQFAGKSWGQSRSLHPVDTYRIVTGRHDPVAIDDAGRPCWLWTRDESREWLIVGTDLGTDLVRFRQGDPARADDRQSEALWGIPGERPNYLFERQIPAGAEHERPADNWVMALAATLTSRFGEVVPPLLPGAAPGAVVVTGDDDQSFLQKYQRQLEVLGGLPITYFLHPLTKHTAETLKTMGATHRVELGLHPDALEDPGHYAELFRDQAAWFQRLTGERASLVRNHGFLNDGYWSHLPVWLEQGVRASANLPGVDGTVLNGSLLPARLAWEGALTPHWSMLTAIGDGVRFALGADGPQSGRCVTDMADRIVRSGLPGVMVLNLHPQNVDETLDMHAALHDVMRRGFVAMTLGECLDWFSGRDVTLQ